MRRDISYTRSSSSSSVDMRSSTKDKKLVTLRYKSDEDVFIEEQKTPTLEEMGPEQAAAARMIRMALDSSLSPKVVAQLPPVINNRG